jgi:hypothetical protein
MSRTEAGRAGNRGIATGGGSAGRPGGVGTQRSVFTSQDGLSKGITVAVGPELQKKNAQRAATYNAAANEWNQGAKQRSFANFLNAASPMGFSMEPPDINRPSTFSGGKYHLGWNPGSLLGMATGAFLPGSGFVTGPLGQMAYTAMGGKNLILGGEGDMGMQTWDAPGSRPNPTGPMTPGGGQLAGKAEGGALLSELARINSGISGNPGAPQAISPTSAAPTPQPNYQNMLASIQQITPGYGVSLPGYRYRGRGV